MTCITLISRRPFFPPVAAGLPAGWSLQRAGHDDVPALAILHRQLMPDDLLPSLGLSLLAGHFWPRLLALPQAETWLLRDAEGAVAGFHVVASERMACRIAFYCDFRFCLAVLARLLLQPRVLLHGISVLLAPLRLQQPLDRVPAELILLGLRPDCQGRGLGRVLLQHALQRLGPVACLVKTASESTTRFYQRAGFEPWGRELRDARSLHLLVRAPA